MTEFLTADQRDLEGVGTIPWTGVNATLTRDTVSPIDGTQSLKVVADADGLMYVFPTASQFPVVSGVRTYWAHVRVRGPVGRAMQFWVRRWHADLVTYTDSVVEFTATGEIQQLANFITTVEDTPAIGMYVLDLASTTGSTYWIDGASLTDSLGFPDVIVEVAFAAGPNDESPVWTDIGEWVTGNVRTSRGGGEYGEAFRAGTFSIDVDNTDRRFDPTNTSSPYYPNVVPNKQIRIRARFPSDVGTVYPIITGLIDAWPLWWNEFTGGATITATDKTKAWEQAALQGSAYSASVLVDEPSAYWQFNETNSDQRATDSSGNERHGTYYGSPIFGLGDPLSDAGDGAIDFGTVRRGMWGYMAAGKWDFGTGPYAFEFWFRSEQMLGPDTERSLFFVAQFDGTFITTGVWLDYQLPAATTTEPAGGQLRFFCPFLHLDSPTALDDSKWHHVVAQRLVSGDAELYVDGVLVASASPGANSLAANQLYVGGIGGTFVNAGFMDDVSIYSSPLTATKVAAHYAARNAWFNDRTGARINRILDLVGVPTAGRSIDSGVSRLMGINSLSGSALSHMQLVTASEFGSLFIKKDGVVRFRDRHALLDAPYTVSHVTLTDEAGSDLTLKRYSRPRIVYDEQSIRNEVITQRDGGAPRRFRSSSSIATYGKRSWSRTGLLNISDNSAGTVGYLIFTRHKEPFLEIPSITVQPYADQNLWEFVLGLELEDRITVVATPSGTGSSFTREMYVRGISHNLTADPLNWETTLDLATAEATPSWWRAGISEAGVSTVAGA